MRDSLLFFVNGKRQEVRDARACWTLAEYLREELRLAGTKVVCAEGDCGACSVLVGRLDAGRRKFEYQPIDACIAFLYQLDGCHVVSVEGLKSGDALSPVQQAMVDCYGSQCGFCTPGFVVTLHDLLERADSRGCGPIDRETLRTGLSGNLCRCTGYEQILEGAEAAATREMVRIADQYDEPSLVEAAAKRADESVSLLAQDGSIERRVLIPATLAEAAAWKAQYPEARLVNGATDLAVQRNLGRIDSECVICLNRVAGLGEVQDIDGALKIGAGATWSDIEPAVREHVPEFWNIVQRFGSPQIRNLATIGGNLANASPIADSIPFLYVIAAELELVGAKTKRRVPINDFYLGYKSIDLAADEIIAAVHVPLPAEDELLKLYKVSKRRDMDISTVTAALWCRREGDTIAAARFALGGVGPTVVRCTAAEEYAAGRTFSEATFAEAGRIARDEIAPITDVRAGAAYRRQLAENLFVKAYCEWSRDTRLCPA